MGDKHLQKRIKSTKFIAKNSNSYNHHAILLYKGTVVAEGYNTFPHIGNITPRNPIKTEHGKTNYSIHAEYNAIKNYITEQNAKQKKSQLHKLDMILFAISKSGKLNISKPCCSCIRLLKQYGIKKVTYSTNEGKWITAKVSDLEGIPSTGKRTYEKK